jgi:hypothetical protein
MKKLKTQSKKFRVGDVIKNTYDGTSGKILNFPEWFTPTNHTLLNESNSYYVRWVHIGFDLDVEYYEELRLDEWVDWFCEKVEYNTF